MNKKGLYESIMKNISKEIKNALHEEKETKSDAQKAAEAKLSQDEKVDLWIEGKRDINLEACGPDKLRKYYKICKEKDFSKGVAEIEKVAKSRKIDLSKEIKESRKIFEFAADTKFDAKFDLEIDNAIAQGNRAKGFMMYDPNGKTVIVYQYDELDDLWNLYGISANDVFYNKVDALEVGETAIDKISNAIHTRIW